MLYLLLIINISYTLISKIKYNLLYLKLSKCILRKNLIQSPEFDNLKFYNYHTNNELNINYEKNNFFSISTNQF